MTFTLLGGRLKLEGDGPSEDALWLAASVHGAQGGLVLDAGCGSGVAGLALRVRCADCRVTGVDMDPKLVAQALANGRLNDFEDYGAVASDILAYTPEQPFDAVICNPPFYAAERGHESADEARQRARHMPDGLLTAWGTHLLKICSGPLYWVLHEACREELRGLAEKHGLKAEVAALATHPTRPAKRLLARLSPAKHFEWLELQPVAAYEKPLRQAILAQGEELKLFSQP